MNTTFKCEQCGEEVEGTEYYNIIASYECPYCGYCKHWTYGNIMLQKGDEIDEY